MSFLLAKHVKTVSPPMLKSHSFKNQDLTDHFRKLPAIISMDHGITTSQLITVFANPSVVLPFQEFAKQWGFSHNVSTPHYPQSNGKVEAAVKFMKNSSMYVSWNRRSLNQDKFCQALLQYRNTPSCKDSLSPTQKLYGCPPSYQLTANPFRKNGNTK